MKIFILVNTTRKGVWAIQGISTDKTDLKIKKAEVLEKNPQLLTDDLEIFDMEIEDRQV